MVVSLYSHLKVITMEKRKNKNGQEAVNCENNGILGKERSSCAAHSALPDTTISRETFYGGNTTCPDVLYTCRIFRFEELLFRWKLVIIITSCLVILCDLSHSYFNDIQKLLVLYMNLDANLICDIWES